MPKKPKNRTKKQAETRLMWLTTFILAVLASVIFLGLKWAQSEDESELAQTIRDVTGIQLLQEPAPPPEPAPNPFDSDIEPPPEVEPEPVVIEEPEPPEPETIAWDTFVNRSGMWPDNLKITVDQTVALTYRSRKYGEVSFQSGQILDVISFNENGYAYGKIGGTEMEVQLSATNFETWFEKEHGDLYHITYPEKKAPSRADDFDQKLITELRRWCLQNYKTPLIEIGENSLILRSHSSARKELGMDYAQEALNVARAYLRIQAELGGRDNYASCEIRDSETGALLGSKGIFMPRF